MTNPKEMTAPIQVIKARSAAKLNLTFDVLGRLPDGYHAIKTIFQSIDLEDDLEFKFIPADSDTFAVTLKLSPESSSSNTTVEPRAEGELDFPLQEDNLIVKAARKFSEYTGFGKGIKLEVKVTKRIPIAAGLAGGSGNAAATLMALNDHCGGISDWQELAIIAGKLGADIPFFLKGGTCIGSKKGEQLESLAHGRQLFFIIVKPRHISIPTAELYRTYDEFLHKHKIEPGSESHVEDFVAAIKSGNLEKLAASFQNAFEPVVFARHPEIAHLRERMRAHGCLNANITGSGPTLYGLVPSIEAGHAVRQRLAQDNGFGQVGGLDFWVARLTETAVTVVSN